MNVRWFINVIILYLIYLLNIIWQRQDIEMHQTTT
jgi:hypothetical protein